MALTSNQYINLWTNHFKGPFNQTNPPSYQDYLQRESYFEDYLDIFRNQDTRVQRGIAGPHPFQQYLGNQNPPKIKYIMVGEAAPPKGQTFFYDINHLGETKWLGAPIGAFGISKNLPKVNKLYALAMEGYLLIDLYPFAVAYETKIRPNINNSPFWQNVVDIVNLVGIQGLVQNECLIAFSGPAATHHRIAHQINQPTNGSLPLPNHCGIKLGQNFVSVNGQIIPPTRYSNYLIHWDQKIGAVDLDGRIPVTTPFISPIYKCEAWDGSLLGPNAQFLKVAFDLP